MTIPAASILFVLATFPPALAPGATALPDVRPAETAPRGDGGAVLVEAVADGALPGITMSWLRGEAYRVYVYAMNDWTDAIRTAQWRLKIPQTHLGYVMPTASFGRPSPDIDFFNGQSLFFQNYLDIGSTSVASAQSTERIPIGDDGYLEYYDVYVADDAPLGEFDFVVDNALFLYDTSTWTPGTITNDYSFRIVLPQCADCVGDINEDGVVDLLDFSEFVLCYGSAGNDLLCAEETMIRSDLVWDGQIDLLDFAEFAANFGATSPLVQDDSP